MINITILSISCKQKEQSLNCLYMHASLWSLFNILKKIKTLADFDLDVAHENFEDGGQAEHTPKSQHVIRKLKSETKKINLDISSILTSVILEAIGCIRRSAILFEKVK